MKKDSTKTAQSSPPEAVKTARIAASWWARAVEGRVLGTSGEGSVDALLVLAQGAGGLPETSAFEQALFLEIVARLNRGSVHLSTDYGPEGLLLAVARGVGSRGLRWPTKTSMWIDNGEVTVRAGYQARTTRLLGEPHWSVQSYAPRKDDGESFSLLYEGKDEAAARAAFEAAAAKIPKGTLMQSEANWDPELPAPLLYKDGDRVS